MICATLHPVEEAKRGKLRYVAHLGRALQQLVLKRLEVPVVTIFKEWARDVKRNVSFARLSFGLLTRRVRLTRVRLDWLRFHHSRFN